jgi:hypothetical protein
MVILICFGYPCQAAGTKKIAHQIELNLSTLDEAQSVGHAPLWCHVGYDYRMPMDSKCRLQSVARAEIAEAHASAERETNHRDMRRMLISVILFSIIALAHCGPQNPVAIKQSYSPFVVLLSVSDSPQSSGVRSVIAAELASIPGVKVLFDAQELGQQRSPELYADIMVSEVPSSPGSLVVTVETKATWRLRLRVGAKDPLVGPYPYRTRRITSESDLLKTCTVIAAEMRNAVAPLKDGATQF